MDQFNNSVMIALLPTDTDWCAIECPHMTLVYAGEKQTLSPSAYNEMGKDALSIADLAKPITLEVLGVEVFGDEEKVDVLRLHPTPELLAMRHVVERWNASKHPFNPHATIGPTGTQVTNIPSRLIFNTIMVGWGIEQLTFWLKGGVK